MPSHKERNWARKQMTVSLMRSRWSNIGLVTNVVILTMFALTASASDDGAGCDDPTCQKKTKTNGWRPGLAASRNSHCWCPDDYQIKSAPCIPKLRTCFGCDDYCCKPSPQLGWPGACFTADDYCRKPVPCFHWLANPFLRCSPDAKTDNAADAFDYMNGKK